MKQTYIECQSSNLENEREILSLLKNKVFHVTTLVNWQKIKKDGFLKIRDYSTSGFASSKYSYFRYTKCVSFFDYRIEDQSIKESLLLLSPLDVLQSNDELVILFLREGKYLQLQDQPCTSWCLENQYNLFVPNIEKGILSPVNIDDYIEEIIIVNIKKSLSQPRF